MRRIRWALPFVVLSLMLWLGSTRWVVPAQERPGESPAAVTVDEALHRKCKLAFTPGSTLADVTDFLRKMLKAPVVLDLAALDRLGITPEANVELEIEGVRLTTALKLLLDQVGLTYHVVPEDNLLILTDVDGAEDRYDHILAELKALHRDLHDLQDTVDEMFDTLAPIEPPATIQKPTIVEEIPIEVKQGESSPPAKHDPPPARARPG